MRGADVKYQFQQIDFSKMKTNDIIHFGSATALLPGNLKETYFKLFQYAKEQNHFISFDPNYRDTLITDKEQFSKDCLYFIAQADFVKVSEEEAIMLSKTNINKAAQFLLAAGARLLPLLLANKGHFLQHMKGKKLFPLFT